MGMVLGGLRHVIEHDNVSHHPLGAGSYVFKDSLIAHLNHHSPQQRIVLHIGTQPNSSPHIGTILTFAVAFHLAAKLKADHGREVFITLGLVDTAPSEKLSAIYWRNESYMPDFLHILDTLQTRTGVTYQIRNQEDFLATANLATNLPILMAQRDKLAADFAPRTRNLGIRSACPKPKCGLADKHGVHNKYSDDSITFLCPYHGEWRVYYNDPVAVAKLEFNTPMRNLLRAMTFTSDPTTSRIHVTGSDYAGYYQEQLLWRHLKEPCMIFYTPLIVDWSGAKLSKSLYVKTDAYQLMKDKHMDYLISYKVFREQGKDLAVIFDEVEEWVKHPYKLFRSYSVAYIDALFNGQKPVDGSLGKS
ncbi:hypothetical protein DL96DRAFT_1694634 [Flagelloscypha sp. PMI_526]|nr:hypothetical protein DL96DRAFT_1694634 [Flagelloscypha sp. PMI_526]